MLRDALTHILDAMGAGIVFTVVMALAIAFGGI